MHITVQTIAELVQGDVIGNPDTILTSPGKIEEAAPGSITFLANEKYEPFLYLTDAAAVLVNRSFIPSGPVKSTLIKVDDVYHALSKLLGHFEQRLSFESGVSSNAFIDNSAKLADNISIGHYCIIKSGVSIGEGSVLHGQVYIGDNVRIGKNVKIYPGVKIYHNCIIGDECVIHANAVIGSDGFGFAHDKNGNYSKIPQIGNVVLGNNVEVGANTVIDRGTMGSTKISQGVKLDNLIQIAHNVVIGKNTAIAAQAGVAGSTKIGENCMIGGQVGIVGHIEIADGTMIQAQSGVASKVTEANSKLYGSPALEYSNYLKSYAYFKKFPELVSQIRALEKEIDKLKQTLNSEP